LSNNLKFVITLTYN